MTKRDFEAFEEIDSICRSVAARYAARCPWASADDARQEAWVAALEARRTWNPARGTPLGAYLRRAAVYRVLDHVIRASKPVSGPRGRARKLAGVGYVGEGALAKVPAPDPGEAPRAERWWARLRELVLADVRAGWRGGLAERALFGREGATKIARRARVSVWTVHGAACRARRRARDDRELREEYFGGPR